MEKLTAKQEKFVQEYISNGGNATKAYRSAYDAENMKEATINSNSCNLLKNNKIATRLDAYREETKNRVLYTAEQSFKKLDEILGLALCPDGESGRINLQAALKAEELKGKLTALYTERIEQMNVNVTPFEVKIIE